MAIDNNITTKYRKQFNKSNADEDRILYCQKRREYKELLRDKKVAYRKKALDSLNNSSNPTDFWNTVRTYCQATKRVEKNNITEQDWFDHFRKLFHEGPEMGIEDDTVPVETTKEAERMSVNNDEENEDDETNILNDDIKEYEDYAAIRALKNGKATGPDGVISEFFKYATVTTVPFLIKHFQ